MTQDWVLDAALCLVIIGVVVSVIRIIKDENSDD